MQSTIALLSLLGAAVAQGVTEPIAPQGSAPNGCSKDHDGKFEVTVASVKNAKRSEPVVPRADCGGEGILVVNLAGGILKDAQDRTGYIASNYQFQFDKPAQSNAIYTAGFSYCGNGSLALGPSTTFYQCKSGDFWNLYDRSWAAQCEPVQIIAIPCGAGSSNAATQNTDGQVVATQQVTTTKVVPLSDGQPQVITTVIPVPICQIGDGQVQGKTTPCASITTAPPAPPLSQSSDGQIEVTQLPPVVQTSDGQVQVTGAPVSQTSDGQIQVTATAAPVANSTLSKVPKPTTPAPTPPVQPAAAGRVEAASLAAFVVGLVCVVAAL